MQSLAAEEAGWLWKVGDAMRVHEALYPAGSTPAADAVKALSPERLRELQTVVQTLPPMTFRQRLSVYASALVVIGSFLYIPAVFYWAYRRFWKGASWRQRALLLAIAIIILRLRARGPWPAMRTWRGLWAPWAAYVGQRVIFDEGKVFGPLAERVAATTTTTAAAAAATGGEPLLYAMIPHGTYPFAQGLSMVGTMSRIFGRLRVIVAPGLLRVPVFGPFLQWMGSVGCGRADMAAAMAAARAPGMDPADRSLIIIPGGIAEMFHVAERDPVAHIGTRRGFVRMAMAHGMRVAPVYCFGNRRLFRVAGGRLARLLKAISRRIGVSLMFFYGHLGLPIPFRRPLLYVVGQPIDMIAAGGATALAGAAGSEPTPEQVARAHDVFVQAMRALFDKYKILYGYGDRNLRIV